MSPTKETLSALIEFDLNEGRRAQPLLAGVDEAGRGPLAGPVVAAAVILFRNHKISYLNDSKKIAAPKREKIYHEIARAGLVGIGVVDEKTIDEINIYQATRLAMKRAVLSLQCTPKKILVDGNLKLDLPLPQKAIVKGDQKSASIAAASIVAKVYRDGWMQYLNELYPNYGFSKHKGYATTQHLAQLKKWGPAPVHRKSFAPVHSFQEVL